MLRGLPVAVLDFDNVPPYLPSAWRISAPSQVAPAVAGLLDPVPARMAYQDEWLHTALECRSPATPRLAALVERMIEAGCTARATDQPLRLPARILPADGTMPLSVHLDLGRQYRDHPTFGDRDLFDMQRRLAMLQQELSRARGELARRSLGYWLDRGFRKAWRWLRRVGHTKPS
jgi:hypothetical protein